MNYLLTQEEYDALRTRQSIHTTEQVQALQAFCTRAANEWPIKLWGNAEATTWGCILTPESSPGYCDECPANEVCPHPHKEWSK